MNLAKANPHIVSGTTKPAHSTYMADVQARVQELSKNLEGSGNQHKDIRLIDKQRGQIQPHAALPRSKTVQSGRPRTPVMSNQMAEPATRLMGFNPLHPSSELPPEQLVRLLKMASKASRKKRRTHVKTEAVQKTQRVPTSEHQQPRSKLFLYAALTGTLFGAIISAYLWWNYAPQITIPPSVTPSTKAVIKPAQSMLRSVASVAEKQPVATAPVISAPIIIDNDPEWQAAIQAERLRLLVEAESRLTASIANQNAVAEVASE